MKKLELVRKGNTRTLLTVTPERITIKFKDGISDTDEGRVQAFFLKVAEKLEADSSTSAFSMRGTLMDDHWRITMKSSGGFTTRTFAETDF